MAIKASLPLQALPVMVSTSEARQDLAKAAGPVKFGLGLRPFDGAFQPPAQEALLGEGSEDGVFGAGSAAPAQPSAEGGKGRMGSL